MKVLKNNICFIIFEICLLSLLSACQNQNNFSNNNNEIQSKGQTLTNTKIQSKEQASVNNKKQSENNEDVVWNEITKNGVNEELLIKNMNKQTLTYIAQQLQDIVTKIYEKGEREKFYWLTGQWFNDLMGSKQYRNVISLGNKAMKPLFLIIYKSKDAGMYEWACSKALTELSGLDFSDVNNGCGWGNSREFLELFIERIPKQNNK